MRVFMLGWEFPPHISGGLGTACYGMTRGLDELGVSVCFVLPTAVPPGAASHVTIRSPANLVSSLAGPGNGAGQAGPGEAAAGGPTSRTIEFQHLHMHRVDAVLQPYGNFTAHEKAVRHVIRKEELLGPGGGAAGASASPGQPGDAAQAAVEMVAASIGQPPASPPRGTIVAGGAGAHYAGDLMGQVTRYARLAVELAQHEQFDVIHAHDWMTYPAGLAVAAATHKPLVVHVHSTEFDRSGNNVNQQVYDIERMGMHGASAVVCVSFLTRNIVTSRYGVPDEKCDVVYNAVDLPDNDRWEMEPIKHTERIVLFLGRLTMQKGPEYFLRAAKKVTEKFTNVRFVMAGSGDMIQQCVREVADLRLGRSVTFTGFLRGDDVARIFKMADLYVMPSVSEPFGIAPLEALSHNVPVIISKQSGVSEVLTHVLKVDFWDVDEMANKILAVLRHAPLQRTLRQQGHIELRKLSWRDSAAKLQEIYQRLIANNG
jgi:glycosyltransferase involved in cell wall biosynthesis